MKCEDGLYRMTEEEIIEQIKGVKRPSYFMYELSIFIRDLEHVIYSWDACEEFLYDCEDSKDQRLPVVRHALERFKEEAQKLYDVL